MWVVDTCIVIDVLEGLEPHAFPSATLLHKKKSDGLLVCPLTVVELAPAFYGDMSRLQYFLYQSAIRFDIAWSVDDTNSAFGAWHHCIELKRKGKIAKRPLVDILIGAFAVRFKGIITRNSTHFKPYFPKLKVLEP